MGGTFTHRLGCFPIGDSDPYWSSVVLLAPFDEANGSTTFTDYSNSAHTLTAAGNAETNTASPPSFQGTYLDLDGTGDYVTIADSADWHFGSGDFTVEYFARHDLTEVDAGLAQYGPSNRGWAIFESTIMDFYWSTTGANQTNVSGSFSGGTWIHRAISRVGNSVYLYADGTRIATGDMTGVTINNSTRPLVIGANNDGASAYYDGGFAQVRITKGVGRYSAATITVPTMPFPQS